MRLHVEQLGAGPPLVLLHGFTQAGRSWGRLAEELAADHRVLLVDLPGHGASSSLHANLPDAADLLAESCGPATWVGYSLGGRHALHVATRHPDVVHRLVVLGATTGIVDPAQRAQRRARDEQLARHLERVGVAAFLEEWLAQPLFAALSDEAAGRAIRLANTADGLAASLRLAGTGTQHPLDAALHAVACPTLVLAGENDAKFRAEAERIVDAIGANAVAAVIPGAGHAAHAERPERFLAALRSWLDGPGTAKPPRAADPGC